MIRKAGGPERYLESVMCPACHADDTRVVDSRSAEDGAAIRRRRHCGTCDRRFTTFERIEEVPLIVVKRDGGRVPFDRDKVARGVMSSAKGRSAIAEAEAEALACGVEEEARMLGADITSEWVGLAVLDRLRRIDHVAALRFASVYKGFTGVDDFEREMKLIKLDATVTD